MDRRQVLALSGALMAGALAGCSESVLSGDGTITQAAPGPEPDIDDDDLRELVQQTNGFAFDLYRALLKDQPDRNIFTSPLSVSFTLAMTYAGARGTTRDQMREVLRYTHQDGTFAGTFDTLQSELDERGDDLNADADVGDRFDEDDEPVPFNLSIVNSVWGQDDYPFRDEYLMTLEEDFGSALHEVDYADAPDAVRHEINEWVAAETEDRIDELLPEDALDEFTRLVLVNSIYFVANWKHPFEKSATDEGSFIALDGREHAIPMMRNKRSWKFAEIDGTRAVELPYIGDDVSMLVILPPEDEFESYERSFDGETLAELVDALGAQEGTVRLPRFEFETSLELAAVLKAMGMEDAFDTNADFGDMVHPDDTDGSLYIDEVYHDAFVSVDEQGTEAAAATGVVLTAVSENLDAFTFEADRPFLYVIRDKPTDTVLFMGRVVDPADWA